MKKYFYSDGKEKHGPLTLDELKQEDISKETLIWFEGIDDWKLAGDLDEMKPILELQPPPIFTNEKNESIEPEVKAVEVTDKNESQGQPTKKGMFSNPFSFDGRIRRMEFGISFIIYSIVFLFLNVIISISGKTFFGLVYIPLLWFNWAQAAKRCHDLGKNGWWQIIPFYIFWLIFQDGQSGSNKYGYNPKG